MTLIQKKWYFRIGPELKPDGEFERYQYADWATAKAEATRLAGIAEEEMIEVEETTLNLPDGPVTNRMTTGNRAYRYYNGQAETPVNQYGALTPDYYADRKQQEAQLRARPPARSRQ